MKIGNISLTGKNQSSQSCSNHIVQSFTVLFYWKDNLLCKGKMMLTNERLHEMGKEGREERGIGWVTHYYWNARCLISTTVQAAHNYGLLEVIQNRFIRGGGGCFKKSLKNRLNIKDYVLLPFVHCSIPQEPRRVSYTELILTIY